MDDDRITRAIQLLKQALGLLDEAGASPEIGAKLQDVITAAEDQSH